MTKAVKRIRRAVIGILAVLSLTVSSVAACACTHHSEPTEEKPSCHGGGHDDAKPDLSRPRVSETCVCIPFANELSVKGESFKLKKQITAPGSALMYEPEPFHHARQLVDFEPRVASYELVISNLNFSRGPPLI